MLFQSATYLLFLPTCVAIFWALPQRWRTDFLLVASYLFYASWNIPYAALMFVLVVLNWWAAVWAERSIEHRTKIVGGAITMDLALLGVFKYLGFAATSAQGALALLGLPPLPFEPPSFLLPLGVSFFTFEFVHFLVDVKRGQLPRCTFAQFHVFSAFFPTQIAGPIKRFQDFLPQLERRRSLTGTAVAEGGHLIARGLFKKMFLADNIAPVANRVFDAVGSGRPLTTLDAWVGLMAFALQIYFDFSGYTDVARGSARLFGFDIPLNFRQPYLARDPSEFWERWHISLSRWLRDYLFIPLGGSRGGPILTSRNLLVTMLLGGLWHGADWHFVAWGGYWGSVLILYHRWRALRRGRPPLIAHPAASHVLGIATTMVIVLAGWAFFRAPVHDALTTITSLFAMRPGTSAITPGQVVLVGGVTAAYYGWVLLRDRVRRIPLPVAAHGLAYAAMVLMAVLGAPPQSVPFIYFQF